MESIIKLENINIYNEKNKIIDNLSFEIKEGDFVAITGPSGAGKSTVLKLLAQLLSTNLKISGNYYYKGQNVEEINPIELRKKVSYCFQSPALFGETVYDNLYFPYMIRKEPFNKDKAIDYLEKVQLDESYLDKSIDELSGGEKQRVALIRNVQFNPEVLLLDEVTSALDTATRKNIWQWLDQYREENDITIIMISHHEAEQDKADYKIELTKVHTDKKEGVVNE